MFALIVVLAEGFKLPFHFQLSYPLAVLHVIVHSVTGQLVFGVSPLYVKSVVHDNVHDAAAVVDTVSLLYVA